MVTGGPGVSAGGRRGMAVPSRHGRHALGRHSVQAAGPARGPSHRGRRLAPVAAFVAVLLVAAGGAWALGARDGGSPPPPSQEAGLLAESRDGTAPEATSSPADRAARGDRPPAAPPLGPVADAATTTAPAPTATRRAPAPTRPPSSRRPPAPRPSSAAPTASTAAAEVTRLTNVERARAGCGAMRIDAKLTAAAAGHSRDMVDRDYFSHTSPDGKGPGDRAVAAGYQRWSGENIAAGYPTPAAVVQGWMDSPGHRANILNCQSKATGVGYDARANMWTQMFGFE